LRQSLLSTSTTSFQELLAAGKRFVVPTFQRDYSWKEEQWEDLWADVLELRGKHTDVHYLGTIVIKNVDEETYEIIDGQQRLATLTIIAVAVVNKLQRMADDLLGDTGDRERSSLLRRRYIGSKDPTKLVDLSSLSLNENNDAFFQEGIVNGKTVVANSRTNKLLSQCLDYFNKKIDGLDNGQASGESLADLLDNVIGKRLIFIRISVDDEMNAYTVFETLNARGLELTATDLLKNYLFSLAEAETRPALERKWRSIIDRVGSAQFPEFLRYFLLMKTSKVRTPRLFKIVKASTRTAEEAVQLLDQLAPYADTFAAVTDPGHERWASSKTLRAHVRDLALFKTRQMMPAIFAADEKLSPDEFEKFLRFLVAFLFRYTVVGGRNTNALEPASSTVAQAILHERVDSARTAGELLNELYVGDDAFRSDFESFRLAEGQQNRKIAKYIFCALEHASSGKTCSFETDEGTIEHIAPQAGFGGRRKGEDFAASIGNLILLEETLNRKAGKRPFDEKIQEYRLSGYEMARKLAESSTRVWDEKAVQQRAKDLAKKASSIWRSRFT
jgi:hypothetical protein